MKLPTRQEARPPRDRGEKGMTCVCGHDKSAHGVNQREGYDDCIECTCQGFNRRANAERNQVTEPTTIEQAQEILNNKRQKLDARKLAQDYITLLDQQSEGCTAEQIADQICLSVAEIPDRFSPEDQPEMMLVTPAELRTIVLSAIENAQKGVPFWPTSPAPTHASRNWRNRDEN